MLRVVGISNSSGCTGDLTSAAKSHIREDISETLRRWDAGDGEDGVAGIGMNLGLKEVHDFVVFHNGDLIGVGERRGTKALHGAEHALLLGNRR